MSKDAKAFAPWIGVAALWTAAFVLSCRLSYSEAAAVQMTGATASIAGALFGEARHALGRQLYETADQYFHRGVPHLKERAFENGFFPALRDQAAPEGHAHLEGEDVKEMLPWLWLTLRMDPQNVEAFRVAAFWLSSTVGAMDTAEEVLRTAQQNNPYNYQIKLDLGRIYLQQGEMRKAARCFDAARRFLARSEDDDPEQRKLETAEILMYRALLHEAAGEDEAALRLFRAILTLFPDRHALDERIQALQSGTAPRVAARDLLASMLRAREEHQCDRDHAQEDDAHRDCEKQNHTDCTHGPHDA